MFDCECEEQEFLFPMRRVFRDDRMGMMEDCGLAVPRGGFLRKLLATLTAHAFSD